MDHSYELELVSRLIDLALTEDLGSGDLATEALITIGEKGHARLVAKADGVVSGQWVAKRVFRRLDPDIRYNVRIQDGSPVQRGEVIAEIIGSYRALLSGERTALNFLQRLSGVATATRRFVDALANSSLRLLDTRKTTPGHRILEKRAVRDGGGYNHRMGLYDLAMIKDNHIAAAGGIAQAVAAVRQAIPVYTRIEVETESLHDVQEALKARADIIMLDNMSDNDMKAAVKLVDRKALTEASGNVDIARIPAIVATGVDFVSVGAITHSAPSLDLSMRLRAME